MKKGNMIQRNIHNTRTIIQKQKKKKKTEINLKYAFIIIAISAPLHLCHCQSEQPLRSLFGFGPFASDGKRIALNMQKLKEEAERDGERREREKNKKKIDYLKKRRT